MRVVSRRFVSFASLLTVTAGFGVAQGATRTWTGANSGALSDPGNWVGGVAPANGDDLVFPAGPGERRLINDAPLISIRSLTFTGDRQEFDAKGAWITHGITINAPNEGPLIYGTLVVNGNQSFINSGPTAYFGGEIKLNSGTLTIGGSGSMEDLYGLFSGPGSLRKEGTGTLTLKNVHTYFGLTTIAGGVLQIESSFALGGNADGTVIIAPGRLVLNGGVQISEPLSLSGSGNDIVLESIGPANQVNGAITLLATSRIHCTGPEIFEIASPISGAFGVGFSGHAIAVSGNSTYSGGTSVDIQYMDGLQIESTQALGTGAVTVMPQTPIHVGNVKPANAITFTGAPLVTGDSFGCIGVNGGWSGPITIQSTFLATAYSSPCVIAGSIAGNGALTKAGSGALELQGVASYAGATTIQEGTLKLLGADVLPDTSVSIGNGATLDLNGFNDTIGGLNGTGKLLLGAGTLRVGNLASNFTGTTSGTGNLRYIGVGGTPTLGGTASHTGETSVAAGSLFLTGTVSGSIVKTTASTATLSLNGSSTGLVDVQSGKLTASTGTAPAQSSTGSLTLGANAHFEAWLSSPSSHTKINVTGTVTLGGATLDIIGASGSFISGDTFVLIDNDGTDAVVGTFAGHGSNPSTFVFGNYQWALTYTGGDGNDVVLRVDGPALVDAGSETTAGDATADDGSTAGDTADTASGAADTSLPDVAGEAAVAVDDAAADVSDAPASADSLGPDSAPDTTLAPDTATSDTSPSDVTIADSAAVTDTAITASDATGEAPIDAPVEGEGSGCGCTSPGKSADATTLPLILLLVLARRKRMAA